MGLNQIGTLPSWLFYGNVLRWCILFYVVYNLASGGGEELEGFKFIIRK